MAEETVKKVQEAENKPITVTESFEKTDKGLMSNPELYGSGAIPPDKKEDRVF